MIKIVRNVVIIILTSLVYSSSYLQADPTEIPNRLIDARQFRKDVLASQVLRSQRRITEQEFKKMMQEPDTLVLDARSSDKFAQMHIAGSRHLAFTDFTVDSLAKVIPNKNTRVLIYCNNNVENSQIAFPSKMVSAALNLSTFTSLYSYGYHNVYELGPAIDPAHSLIKFDGTLIP